MTTLIHADIFFFITSIFVVLLIIGFVIALYFVIRILNNLRSLSDTLRKEGELAAEDFHALRERLKAQGAGASTFFHFLGAIFKSKRSSNQSAHYHRGKVVDSDSDTDAGEHKKKDGK